MDNEANPGLWKSMTVSSADVHPAGPPCQIWGKKWPGRHLGWKHSWPSWSSWSECPLLPPTILTGHPVSRTIFAACKSFRKKYQIQTATFALWQLLIIKVYLSKVYFSKVHFLCVFSSVNSKCSWKGVFHRMCTFGECIFKSVFFRSVFFRCVFFGSVFF